MKISGFNPFRASRRRADRMPYSTAEADSADLPASCDSLIIGGGVAGLTTAIELAERGQSVVVVEKGLVGAEQTSRALGWVSSLGDGALRLPLSSRSKSLWAGYAGRFGVDTSFERTGVTLLCRSEAEMESLAQWRAEARQSGAVDAVPFTLAELEARMPNIAVPGLAGAWHQPGDGRVFAEEVAPALARIAKGLGVTILQSCAALSLETSAGRVSHVVTEHGMVQANAVVVAGGAWSRHLLRLHGISLPSLLVYGSLYRTAPTRTSLDACGATGSFGWARARDGGLIFGDNSVVATLTPDSFRLFPKFLPSLRSNGSKVSLDLDGDFIRSLRSEFAGRSTRRQAFLETRILAAAPDRRAGQRLLETLRREVVDCNGVEIEKAWGGVIDVMPDQAPVLGELDRIPGVFICTGFSAHGLAMAPAAAEALADTVTGRPTRIRVADYRLNRFA